MNDQAMSQLRAAIEGDEDLRARFAAATTEAEIVALAGAVGLALDVGDVGEAVDVTDAELERVAGGLTTAYTFPQTDWVYCDNPETNHFCTSKC